MSAPPHHDPAIPMIYQTAAVMERVIREDPDRWYAIVRAQAEAEIRGLPIPSDAEAIGGAS